MTDLLQFEIEWTVSQAEDQFEQAQQHYEAGHFDNLVTIAQHRLWKVLGAESLDDLGDRWPFLSRIRMDRVERRQIVAPMRESGMSTRDIAAAVGVSHPTVLRDLVSGGTDVPPEKVKGRDGKTYTPPPPPPPYKPDPDLVEWLRNGQPAVVNMRDKQQRLWLTDNNLLLRIDRGSKWGNPFVLDDDGDRGKVIAAYRDHYLPHKPSLLNSLHELEGKALGCWCAPQPCHGDILVDRWWAL